MQRRAVHIKAGYVSDRERRPPRNSGPRLSMRRIDRRATHCCPRLDDVQDVSSREPHFNVTAAALLMTISFVEALRTGSR